MKTVFLVRHGEVEERYQNSCRGITDCDLAPEGVEQSLKNIQFLVRQGIERVFTTGLKRTDFVGRELQKFGVPHTVDRRFQDINFGEWEGCSWEEIGERWQDLLDQFQHNPEKFVPPGGEPLRDVKARVIDAWRSLTRDRLFTKIALIAHGGVNAYILAYEKNKPLVLNQHIGAMNKILLIGDKSFIEWENRKVYEEESAWS